jgi:hypothetical protein
MRAALRLGFVLLCAAAAYAQSGVTVELDEVVDNRFSSTDTGGLQMVGSLEMRVKLAGSGLDEAAGARVIIKEAKDDRGNDLASTSQPSDFMPRDYNNGTLQLAVKQPARTATSVRIKGTVELYVPGRDPNANVKIDKALAKLDTPLAAKALTTAKMEITPMSRKAYMNAKNARKIDAKAIEQIRAEGKKQGASEKDIELAIELAKAFDSIDEPLPEGVVILSGRKSDFDRIFRVEILGDDGAPIEVNGRGVSTRGESSLMTLNPSQPPPANASLQLMLVTDKSRVSFPFELKVPLP